MKETVSSSVRLQPGERVVMDVLPSAWWTLLLYLYTGGLWEIWRRRHHFVLTDRRVVVVKGLVRRSEQSVPIDRVQDAALIRSPLSGGRVRLSTAGGVLGFESIGPLTRAGAAAFADALAALISEQRRPSGL